jgi:alkanesulfonate monooxygenase SsuD/methylene tetrahydromethanopterin reductase-like flavin-dependent oxidoreductase (luciferase family)
MPPIRGLVVAGTLTLVPHIDFGYHPPAGDRSIERVDPGTFVTDLERVLDRYASSFESLWISDHFMTNDRYRLECWTLLTWLAARYPQPQIGTIVMANSYRHPPLLAKMAASLQELSGGRLILGYGAGWSATSTAATAIRSRRSVSESRRWSRRSA